MPGQARKFWTSLYNEKRRATDTLRGIAVLFVVLNHYVNGAVPGDQNGFANAIVAIFFLLSGYGIFRSLEHRSPGRLGVSTSVGFFVNRILRLLPVTLALGVLAAIQRQSFVTGMAGILDYWFVASILHCYVAAILSFLLARWYPRRAIVVIAIVAVVGTALYLFPILPETLRAWLRRTSLVYRGIPLGHLLIFVVGMLVAKLHRDSPDVRWKPRLGWVSGITLLLMVGLKVLATATGSQSAEMAFSIAPLPMILLSGWLAMQADVGTALLAVVGTASLPIYIFNGSFRGLIGRLAGGAPPWLTTLVFLAALPLFVGCCVLFQWLASQAHRRIRNVLRV